MVILLYYWNNLSSFVSVNSRRAVDEFLIPTKSDCPSCNQFLALVCHLAPLRFT